MPTTKLLALLAAASGLAQATLPDRPCKNWPSKVAKLHACSTASAFCEDYLAPGGPSFTKTFYATTTINTDTFTKDVTDVVMQTSYYPTITVQADTTPTSTVTITAAATTTFAASCSDDQDSAPSRKLKRANPAANCGIVEMHSSAAISGACNCILASTITSTRTVTGQPAGTTTDTIATSTSIVPEATTVTSTSTATTTVTTTPTACAVMTTFHLFDPIQEEYISHNPGSYYSGDYVEPAADSTVFYIQNGTNYLFTQDGNIACIWYNDGGDPVRFVPAPPPSYLNPLTCSFNSSSRTPILNCVVNAYDNAFNICFDNHLFISRPGYYGSGSPCDDDQLIVVPISSSS